MLWVDDPKFTIDKNLTSSTRKESSQPTRSVFKPPSQLHRLYTFAMPFGSRPYNGWLPSSRAVYNKFINDLLEEATKRHEQNAQHVASVAEFKKDIEANATMVGLFNKSFVQASSENLFRDSVTGA
ncbi:sulfotransferase family domain-containing protein [Rhizoctonia solani AG-1 IA]|uniref:Sulfotransferase family domain-containing protein n=1 Tax=Thanatephorus cucumeris (strain AG1-IA) TaxID=983506 RepID=L8WSJ9_THACA|nr:sulfotransferase family domain-containing protein [Rhizoctonia solani AG-1 IA]